MKPLGSIAAVVAARRRSRALARCAAVTARRAGLGRVAAARGPADLAFRSAAAGCFTRAARRATRSGRAAAIRAGLTRTARFRARLAG